MPELPEVETTRRGLVPLLIGETIASIFIREHRLRWPVDPMLSDQIKHQTIVNLSRRAKYLLVETTRGTLLMHLGMSGSLRYLETPVLPSKHDHVDVIFSSGALLRFNDPRRFGSLHYCLNPKSHWLLKDIGPEPFGSGFTGKYLWKIARNRRVGIKQFLMNNRIVAGVGNIYADESLFSAGIRTTKESNKLKPKELKKLAESIVKVLTISIGKGGTTFSDFRLSV